MITVYLHGEARRRFGAVFELDIRSPAEAVRALMAQFPAFAEFARSANWKVFRHRRSAGVEEMTLSMGKVRELHFAPIPRGAKNNKGMMIGKIVVGVALIAAAIIFAPAAAGLGAVAFTVAGAEVTFASIAMVGVGMVLAGVSGLLTPTPDIATGGYSTRETPEQRQSFLFNGPVNVTEQGQPLPIVCGLRVRTGSVVVSAGIFSERIPT